jgi:hypothetical protein
MRVPICHDRGGGPNWSLIGVGTASSFSLTFTPAYHVSIQSQPSRDMVRLTLTGLGILYTGIALPGICPRYTGCPSFSGVAGARNSSRLSPLAAGTSGGGTGCPLAAERAFETSSMSTSEEPGVPCRLRRRSRSSTSSATAYGKDGLQRPRHNRS